MYKNHRYRSIREYSTEPPYFFNNNIVDYNNCNNNNFNNNFNFNNNNVNIKHKKLNGLSPSDPRVWGSMLWFVLHNGAIHFPQNPSPEYCNKMKKFIEGLPYIIPCEVCKQHAIKFLNENQYRLDDICISRDNLFKFFVDFHNVVNSRYGKNTMSLEDAKNLYTSKVNISYCKYD